MSKKKLPRPAEQLCLVSWLLLGLFLETWTGAGDAGGTTVGGAGGGSRVTSGSRDGKGYRAGCTREMGGSAAPGRGGRRVYNDDVVVITDRRLSCRPRLDQTRGGGLRA